MLVDEVELRGLGPDESRHILMEQQIGRVDMLEIADQDGRLAAARARDQPRGIGRGDRFVGASEDGQVREIAPRAVAELANHFELQLPIGMKQVSGFRLHFDLLTDRGSWQVGPGALRDPVPQYLICRVALLQLLPAAMRHLHQRLKQKQARVGIVGVDAAAKVFADQRQLIESRIESAQRQPKAPLAGRRAVARTGTAPLPRQGGEYAFMEGNGLFGLTR